MPQLIVSFGFNKGVPVAGDDDNGGSLDVIDVRTFLSRNPFRDKKLRTKRGTDPEVQADIQMTPDFLLSMQILKDRVEMSTEKVFYIGCTGAASSLCVCCNSHWQSVGYSSEASRHREVV